MENRGYAFIEMVLLMTVVSLGLSSALTILQEELTMSFTEETMEELAYLKEGYEKYFEDTGEFPGALADLKTEPGDVTGWLGPYVQDTFEILVESGLDVFRDPWGNTYEAFELNSWSVELRSIGPNRIDEDGSGDDIFVVLDTNAAAWTETKLEILTAEAAIAAYNAFNAPPDLDTDWDAAAVQLQDAGLLPGGAEKLLQFQKDGWKQTYQTQGDPVDSITTEGPPSE